jgi:NADH-quinone oxidoreductase subunit L
MYWVGVFTAGMTAFYVTRAFCMTFFGEYRGAPANTGAHSHDAHGHDDHGHAAHADQHDHDDKHGHDDHGHGHGTPHESPAVMWIPLVILAVLSLVGGNINIPKFLAPLFPLHEGESAAWLEYVASTAGLLGIALAYVCYVVAPSIPGAIVSTFSLPYRWIYNKYFVDELYDEAIIQPTIGGSRSLLWRVVDAGAIDGIVNGAGTTARGIGGVLRKLQSGSIRSYAAWVVLGSILLIAYAGFVGGSK